MWLEGVIGVVCNFGEGDRMGFSIGIGMVDDGGLKGGVGEEGLAVGGCAFDHHLAVRLLHFKYFPLRDYYL